MNLEEMYITDPTLVSAFRKVIEEVGLELELVFFEGKWWVVDDRQGREEVYTPPVWARKWLSMTFDEVFP